MWTEKTMLSENGDVIKIDTTGRLYHVASLLIRMTSSLFTLLQTHLTQLICHLDFTRRKQDI